MKNKFYFTIGLLLFLFIPVIGFSQGIEVPFCDTEEITDHVYYKIKYNEQTEQADWAAYELTHDELTGTTARKDNFRADPLIITESAQLDDYRGSGYDRGHLVPAGDLKITEQSMDSSFFLSNISPQVPAFNRGIWLDLENVVRTWAWEYGTVYIVTGPVFYNNDYKVIGDNEVAVPDGFFKVVLTTSTGVPKAAGFIIPNEAAENLLESFMVSVDYVESVTGFDFYYQLSDEIENAVEAESDIQSWSWKEFRYSTIGNIKVQDAVQFKYWINSSSGTRHNPSCEYYGNTKNGYYTNDKKGTACGRCGG